MSAYRMCLTIIIKKKTWPWEREDVGRVRGSSWKHRNRENIVLPYQTLQKFKNLKSTIMDR